MKALERHKAELRSYDFMQIIVYWSKMVNMKQLMAFIFIMVHFLKPLFVHKQYMCGINAILKSQFTNIYKNVILSQSFIYFKVDNTKHMKTIYKSKKCESEMMEIYDRQLSRLGIEYEEANINTRFGNTHVLIAGPKDTPPLINLHDFKTLSILKSLKEAIYHQKKHSRK